MSKKRATASKSQKADSKRKVLNVSHVEALAQQLTHGNDWSREKALTLLADDLPAARLALAAVVSALNDADELNRRLVFDLVCRICPSLSKHQSSLALKLQSESPELRLQAIRDFVIILPEVQAALAARGPGWEQLEGLLEKPAQSQEPDPASGTTTLAQARPPFGDSAARAKEGQQMSNPQSETVPERTPSRDALEFVRAYPSALPSRLEWLADHLHIDRRRVLRLMGVEQPQIEHCLGESWAEVVAEREEQATWVDQLLRQLVARFQYDPERIASVVRSQAYQGKVEPLLRTPEDDRERVILSMIAEGGPDVMNWLLEYLSQPA